ncbi:MAG: radical SAM protein, partial [Deltaproteobacteria bacterium]|nr:radical SAM protein [Deltaproteobacteria bacterium]
MTNQKTYKPQRCVYEATLACNLQCRHCGSRAGKARPDELTTAEAEDLFTQLVELGCKRVTISGGEPLMRPDWPELIAAATRSGLATAMISNGLKLDLDTAKRAKASGLRTVGISLDGVGRTHDLIRGRIGHFDAVARAMDSAAAAGLAFTAITTINSLNLHELEQIYRFVRDQGAFSWQVQTAAEMGNMLDNPSLHLRPRDMLLIERDLAELIRRD